MGDTRVEREPAAGCGGHVVRLPMADSSVAGLGKDVMCSSCLLAVMAALMSTTQVHDAAASNGIAIAIHGGAGTITRASMTPEKEAAFRAGLEQALRAGYAVLEKGGRSMDA